MCSVVLQSVQVFVPLATKVTLVRLDFVHAVGRGVKNRKRAVGVFLEVLVFMTVLRKLSQSTLSILTKHSQLCGTSDRYCFCMRSDTRLLCIYNDGRHRALRTGSRPKIFGLHVSQEMAKVCYSYVRR